MAKGVTLGGVRRANEVSRHGVGRGMEVMFAVVLKPVALVDVVVARVGRMSDIELDKEAAVLKAGGMEGNGILECDANQAPLAMGRVAYAESDKEELVVAAQK